MIIIGWSAIIVAFLLLLFGAFEFGMNLGYRDGFAAGEDWWWKLIKQVDEGREEIWREELRR